MCVCQEKSRVHVLILLNIILVRYNTKCIHIYTLVGYLYVWIRNNNVRMIVLVFVLVLYFVYCAVLCACYVDFAPAIHNIPIVFYYFIENVHSCRHMLVSHVYIYSIRNIFMYGNCFVCCMHIGTKGIVYCIAFIWWLLLLYCKRLYHAHHTQLFFAKIHTRIVCKNEALLCCIYLLFCFVLLLSVYYIYISSHERHTAAHLFTSAQLQILPTYAWRYIFGEGGSNMGSEKCNKYNIIVKM